MTRVEIFGKEYYRMKNYESPEITILPLSQDVLTASTGDTPFVEFEW